MRIRFRKAPFYAALAAQPIRYATKGGLETVEQFRAFRLTNDKSVPVLYAVGTNAGEITLHLPGVIASGLIPGRSIAKTLKG